MVDVSAERNSTFVMPFSVETLRLFEHRSGETDAESDATGTVTRAASSADADADAGAPPQYRGVD
ncbi:hypothetical protein ACWD7F_34285 [Streptomyces sp. NPDC005122]